MGEPRKGWLTIYEDGAWTACDIYTSIQSEVPVVVLPVAEHEQFVAERNRYRDALHNIVLLAARPDEHSLSRCGVIAATALDATKEAVRG